MTPDRAERVASSIRAQLADVVRTRMSDPRLPLLAVTDARVSRDLAVADIYVSSLAAEQDDARDELVAVLNHAAGFLRRTLAQRLDMRYTPRLRFHYDELAEQAPRLEALIDRAVQPEGSGGVA